MDTIEFFPDGTPIDAWFYEADAPSAEKLGREYVLTDYNIFDDGAVHTKEIQNLIDEISLSGGGILVVPAGTYLTGSIYLKQGVHLCVKRGGTLKGSDNIADYPICETRMEGETCLYFPALINADGVDGLCIFGGGTIDGNGLRSWRAFWLRRQWNPDCTNKDEQRPRLIYISNSSNVTVSGITLQNSHYWTNHIYKCDHVKYLSCRIFSPAYPIKAPSTDAIDIDVCSDVLIKNCYLEVNDDSVVLKGGKGPWADTLPENGSNERIIIEDCTYGFCHGCLTCGSESIHNRNIIMRRINVSSGFNLLWLKMRPDTPQLYEHILVDEVNAVVDSFININPWTQFFDLKDRDEIPLSYAENITMKNCKCRCKTFFNVLPDVSQYVLKNFCFSDLDISADDDSFDTDTVENFSTERLRIIRSGC